MSKLVKRDNAVDLFLPRQVADSFYDVGQGKFGGDIKDVVKTLTRPVGIAQGFGGEQEHAASLPLAFAHELLSLFVGGDAEKSERSGFRHRTFRIQARDYNTARQES
jgi:hypothetical protein